MTATQALRPVRNACVAVIGTMIGGTFSPQMVALLPGLWVSLLAMVVFVIIAHGVSYGIYRHLGNFDRNTAFSRLCPVGWSKQSALGPKRAPMRAR
ncbi:MAG: AbrB family transcriptional regulator, partial [Rhodobacteraceae bacterium]|nr:AbrB family transcriptional regulator [Paracoccaceae bacterium]